MMSTESSSLPNSSTTLADAPLTGAVTTTDILPMTDDEKARLKYVSEKTVTGEINYTTLDGKYHGVYKRFCGDVLVFLCTYKHGKPVGTFRTWYTNNYPEVIETYDDNHNLNGVREFHMNGSLRLDAVYKNNKLDGRYYVKATESNHHSYTIMYADGKLAKVLSIRDYQDRENVLPDGDIIVYKACKSGDSHVIVELFVPKEAKRVTPFCTEGGPYCQIVTSCPKSRVEYAIVKRIVNRNGEILNISEATSFVHSEATLVYKIGETVRPDGFNDDITVPCGQGINVHRYPDHCLRWF